MHHLKKAVWNMLPNHCGFNIVFFYIEINIFLLKNVDFYIKN